MYPKDFFQTHDVKTKKGQCFVLMPFMEAMNDIFETIREAVESHELNFTCMRAIDAVPFDLRPFRCIVYRQSIGGAKELQLLAFLKSQTEVRCIFVITMKTIIESQLRPNLFFFA